MWLFVRVLDAHSAAVDSRDRSLSHQMNACVSKRSFTLHDRTRTRLRTAHRNPAPLPMLPHADPRAVTKLEVAGQYSLAVDELIEEFGVTREQVQAVLQFAAASTEAHPQPR